MKILFIGDIVGRPGRNILRDNLSILKKEYQFDTLIINGENAAHGKGITPKIYQEFIRLGIDVITLGNHAFAKQIILDELDCCDSLVRPRNMNPTNVGKYVKVIKTKEGTLAVHSILGEVFMNNVSESPFIAFEKSLQEVNADMHLVDFHAEATAEKQTFFYKFKDSCVAILGTHTHVTTADEMVVDGCAYISDVGMTGVTQSILGRDIEEVMLNLEGEKTFYKVASGQAHLSAVLVTIVDKRATNIERIKIIQETY
jgi:metallophosphoesterase (TIGR00282 family)